MRKVEVTVAAIALLAGVSLPAGAAQWFGDFRTGDLRQWRGVHCGSQGGDCPCTGSWWNPPSAPAGSAGACSTTGTPSPLPPGAFQIVNGFPGTTGPALRVQLHLGDVFPDGSGTVRNEVVYSESSATGPTVYYGEGDDRWFAFSVFFETGFGSWSCDPTQPIAKCGRTPPNVFNTIFNMHHTSDTGVPPFGMGLQAACTNDCSTNHTYAINLHFWDASISDSRKLWSEPLQTGVWYNFTLHAHFSASSTVGFLELRMSKGSSVTLAKSWVPLTCPANATSNGGCFVRTLDPAGPQSYLKMGHYRDSGIRESTVLYDHGLVTGATQAEVETSAPPPSSPGPALSTLTDSFGGSAVDTTKWTVLTQLNGTVGEGGGTLNLAPNANTGSAQLLVGSNSTYSLIGSSGFVQAPAVVSSGGSVDEDFALFVDSTHYLEWLYESGSLQAIYRNGGTNVTLTTLTYSPASHLWWRIREASGTVFWETSPDAVSWTSQANLATASLFPLGNVKAYFYTETFGAGSASPGTAKFANFNVAAPSGGCGTSPCVSTLVDSFGGTAINPSLWSVSATDGSASEGGGTLNLTPVAGVTTTRVQVTSVSQYSLVNSQAKVKLAGVPDPNGSINTRFVLFKDWVPGDEIGWWKERSTLEPYYIVGGTATFPVTLTYSPTTHAWLRIRHDGTTIFWETSADGVTWTVRAQIAASSIPFSGTPMNVMFSLSAFSPSGAGTTAPAKYANLN